MPKENNGVQFSASDGAGGLGCRWARAAHSRVSSESDLMLVDADMESQGGFNAHCMHLDPTGMEKGMRFTRSCAHRTISALDEIDQVLTNAEWVILTGLGGGTGTGSTIELARASRQRGAIVVVVAGLPFAEQSFRARMATMLCRPRRAADICIRVSLERLAWQSRRRRLNWQQGSGWIEELVEGLISTIGKLGKINLDLMDLKAIVKHKGRATLIVASGPLEDTKRIVEDARRSPLIDIGLDGAKGCLIQVEGGPDMTLSHISSITEDFTSQLTKIVRLY